MSTIVLRNTKGTPLTWQEGDDNFNNLNTDKIEAVVDDSAPQLGGNLDVNDHNIVSGANNQIRFSTDGAEMVFEKQEIAPSVFASVIRADNLQYVTVVTGGTSILASSSTAGISVEYGDGTNGPININPSGSAQCNIIVDDADTNGEFAVAFTKDNIYTWNNSAFSDPTYGTTINSYDIGESAAAPIGLRGSSVIIATQNASTIVLESGTNADITITPDGTGDLVLDGLKWPQADGTADYFLKTNGSGQLSWAAAGGGGSGTVTSVAVSVPTGLTITSGSPVTTSGTIAIDLASGYAIPTTTSQTNWDTAYTDRNKWDGGSTGLTAATGRTSLGATTVGENLFTLTNPSAIRFLKVNADNTVTARSADNFRTDLGSTTVGDNIFGLTNPSAITFLKINADNTVTARSASNFRTDIGATTVGANLFGLTNPGAVTFIRVNLDNTVTALSASDFRTAIGAGTGAGTVTSVAGTGTVNGLSLSGTVTSTGNITLGGTLDLSSPPAIGATAAAAVTATTLTFRDPRDTVYDIGNSSTSTLTPNATNGSVQTIAATGNFTLSAFTSPISGQSITFIITQDATGSRTLTSTMKFAGATKTLSTAANSIDIMTVTYIGTTYYASLAKGFA